MRLTTILALAAGLVATGGGPSAGRSLAAAVQANAPDAAAETVRATVRTDHGAFEVELYPRLAPGTVRLFLARARAGATRPAEVAAYAGTQVCESRGSAYLVFGCVPFENRGPKPKAARKGPSQPDEIDARAMGLEGRPLGNAQENHDRWQFEIIPRYADLKQKGKPVPPTLEALVEDAKQRGTAAMDATAGKSLLWYLEAVGFSFTPGASPLRVTRGALATYTMWPGEADERFLVALDDMPARDGRATVFGRVVSGFETLDRIQRIPVDKARRPLEPVFISGIDIAGSEKGEPPAQRDVRPAEAS